MPHENPVVTASQATTTNVASTLARASPSPRRANGRPEGNRSRGGQIGSECDGDLAAAFILAGDELRAILAARTRPIVLEITEHDPIHDYGALRSAFVALGSGLRLAVDDAGAGVANFNHLVELRPHFVKVDMGLVRGVNADLARQALIVALLHFAGATDCQVVAEGIETEAERAVLEKLEVPFGQGYLFGRPAVASIWAAPEAPPSTPHRVTLRAISGGRQPRA